MTQLILLRHGDRDAGYGDVPLSIHGFEQAQQLINAPALLKAQILLSSPKLRTQQTLQPLSQFLKMPMEILPDLDQRKSIETSRDFRLRVKDTLFFIEQNYSNQLILAVSHSDWLQEAILSMSEDSPELIEHCLFACAEFKQFAFKNNKWVYDG